MPVCGRVQRILKKLPRATSFGPRQTLLATMREKESMFWSRSSWLFFSCCLFLLLSFSFVFHISAVYVTTPGGGGEYIREKKGGIEKKNKNSKILVLKTKRKQK